MSEGSGVNYAYFKHYVQTLPNAAGLRVLDYGCGSGEIVALLREAGVDCVGCDVFYEGSQAAATPAAQALLQAGFVQYIDPAGPLPYPPASFDLILANMVFEHVEDLERVLDNLRQVLKPTGHLLAHFPTREVIREGHIGIPFAHRFPRGSRMRHAYTRTLRALGLGYFKEKADGASAWADLALGWMDQYCHYRPMSEVRRSFEGRFAVSFNEMMYMRFRAGGRSWLRGLLGVPGLGPLYCVAFRRLGFTAFVLRPLASGPGGS
jgi:SAM-dependent methyltransferase